MAFVKNPFDPALKPPSKYIEEPGTSTFVLTNCEPVIAAGTADTLCALKCTFTAYGADDKGNIVHGKLHSMRFNPFEEKTIWIMTNWLSACMRDEEGNPIEEAFDWQDPNAVLNAAGGRPFRGVLERSKPRPGQTTTYINMSARGFAAMTPGDYLDIRRVIGEMGDPLAPLEDGQDGAPSDNSHAAGQGDGWGKFDS